jgi:hypothetical protein
LLAAAIGATIFLAIVLSIAIGDTVENLRGYHEKRRNSI